MYRKQLYFALRSYYCKPFLHQINNIFTFLVELYSWALLVCLLPWPLAFNGRSAGKQLAQSQLVPLCLPSTSTSTYLVLDLFASLLYAAAAITQQVAYLFHFCDTPLRKYFCNSSKTYLLKGKSIWPLQMTLLLQK